MPIPCKPSATASAAFAAAAGKLKRCRAMAHNPQPSNPKAKASHAQASSIRLPKPTPCEQRFEVRTMACLTAATMAAMHKSFTDTGVLVVNRYTEEECEAGIRQIASVWRNQPFKPELAPRIPEVCVLSTARLALPCS